MTSDVVIELENSIRQLNPSVEGCRAKIIEIRRAMDALCDQGELSISEWRVLLDRTSAIQAQCAGTATT